MRDIKFRGLNYKSEWEYGYLVRAQFCAYDKNNFPWCNNSEFLEYEKVTADVLGSGEEIAYGYKIYRDGQQSSVWVRRDSVGQYTGKEDKNGTEIYAGAVIEEMGPHGTSSICKIVWAEYLEKGDLDLDCLIIGFVREWADGTKSPFGYNEDVTDRMEVIGSIAENPELLDVNR